MKAHIVRLKTPSDLEFGSVEESIVYNLIPDDELISKEELGHKIIRYSAEKGVRKLDNYRTVSNLINLLVEKKALKEISGENINRALNIFRSN